MIGAVEAYNYIVVGAGTAGCVLAARLTEEPGARVLLLEAGSAERTRAMAVPSAWPENLGSAADWGYVTTSQAAAGPLLYPRGRALGGSGAINAMAHVRGHPASYDRWAASGAPGWGFADLLPYFRRTERAEGRDPARLDRTLRGTAGPIRVAPAGADRHPVARAFAEALTRNGCPVTDDLSGRVREGVAWADLAIADGERVSPADGYLRPVLSRPNLDVATSCVVTRLNTRHGRCTGVSYVRHGVAADAVVDAPAGASAAGEAVGEAVGEVILAAGAIGSPYLLLRSGIGPAGPLRALGIDPVADIPGVGENLQDHPTAKVCCATPVPPPVSRYNYGETYAALRSDLAGEVPDLHLFPILLPLPPGAGFAPPAAGFLLVAAAMTPDSRGTVRLASLDAPPLIDPGFLTDERDLDRLAAGLKMVRRAAAQASFGDAVELYPGPEVSTDAALRGYIRRTVDSYYHPVGTCRMGSGDDAVVDPELRVRGVAGLRVADASIMPLIPNAHPHATILAIAERAAALISGRPV
jgi:choline dehydrogenase-like flavoprotein